MRQEREWHFRDLGGFKDFLGMVVVCAPDSFLYRDWLPPDEQMDLETAFAGIRFGLDLAEKEIGLPELTVRCRQHADAALLKYRSGNDAAGQAELEEIERLLSPFNFE
jgi:hypothetical protein